MHYPPANFAAEAAQGAKRAMMKPVLTLLGALATVATAACNFTVDAGPDGTGGVTGSSTASLGMITRIQTGEFYAGAQVSAEVVVTGVEHSDDGAPAYNPIGIRALFVSDVLEQAAEYSGIYADLPISESLGFYAVGDLLSLDGLYSEYYQGSQIDVVDVIKLGEADLPVPVFIADPSTVATRFAPGSEGWSPSTDHGVASEAHEGVLIQVRDVQVTVGSLGHGMFEIKSQDASEDDYGLAVDTQLYFLPPPSRPNGTRFTSITGILTYTFEAFKLAPRSFDDFEQ